MTIQEAGGNEKVMENYLPKTLEGGSQDMVDQSIAMDNLLVGAALQCIPS